jgi:7,8-dihydropterin-6-yl-methyl-4-(beta-D-ribofuranosyl)aminobenzene 5'-phosphate synthase
VRRRWKVGLAVIVALPLAAFTWADVKLARGEAEVDAEWLRDRPGAIGAFGTTKSLTIVPLIDFHTARPELRGEGGVSYLVKTDDTTVLFDLGLNRDDEDPSPLEQNLHTLSLTTADFSTIVISHAHPDHVGGGRWSRQGTFSLGVRQVDLTGKRVFVPVPLTYPGLTPVLAHAPTIISAGLATTGTIPRQLFVGRTDEQALAVNVEGKGIVLIVGCGHQTLARLLERTQAVFGQPVYGVVGGLHFPVPDGRLVVLGLNVQRWAASGTGPFHPLTARDVDEDIARLKGSSFLSVGGHDSSDEVVTAFRTAFGPAYHDLKVGEPLVVAP